MAEIPKLVPGTWSDVMGIRIVAADAALVVGELDIERKHRQAFGLVHGGVYAGFIETLTSMGAALAVHGTGRVVVGIENHTSFLHAVERGRLHGRAVPVHIGKTTQLWEATLRCEDRVVASGRVRLLCREPAKR